LGRANVRRHYDAIVHPLAFSSGGYDPRAAKVGKMPRYLRLGVPQYLHKIADTKLLIAHQVQETKSCVVAKCLKEAFDIEGSLTRHAHIIYALTNV
jgi:hypothetical protein